MKLDRLLPGLLTLTLVACAWQGAAAPVPIPFPPPTVQISTQVTVGPDQVPVVEWELLNERPVIGFYLLRTDARETVSRLNTALLPAGADGLGVLYRYRDLTAPTATSLLYTIEAVLSDGTHQFSAPIAVGSVHPAAKPAMVPTNVPIYTIQPYPTSAQKVERIKSTVQESRLAAAAPTAESGPRVRIRVRESGLYRLTAETLAAKLGMTTDQIRALIARRHLRLSCQGELCAWIPAPAHEAIYFYNQMIESQFTETNVYWLESGAGIEVPPRSSPASESPAAVLTHALPFERQAMQQMRAFSDSYEDFWLWGQIYAEAGSTSFPFVVNGIDANTTNAALKVVLYGGSNAGVAGEHHAYIGINGTEIGTMQWQGNIAWTGAFTFASALLGNGVNQVNLRASLDSGAPYSLIYMNRFELTCTLQNRADQDYCRLPAAAAPAITVSGFSSTNLLVAEVLGPTRIRSVTGWQIAPDGADGWAVSVQTAAGNQGYIVSTHAAVPEPDEITGRPGAPALLATTNAVDYLLITHPALQNETRQLEAFRTGQIPGLRARTVLVDDIYDAFAHGIETPYAIKDLLTYARQHWTQPPAYVLLAGEGSLDYKNYLGTGENLVPCLMVKTPFTLYSSDNHLADVEGDDGVPEFAIGRLPASTAVQMSNMVSKIITHATTATLPAKTLLLADNPDAGGDFRASCDAMENLLADTYTTTKAYLGLQSLTQVRSQMTNSLNSGLAMMLYFGHSAWNRLAGEGILHINDMTNLANSPHLPVAILQGCVVNRFEYVGYDYVGESLLTTPVHGAVATWGSSGESYNSYAQTYCQYFLEEHRNDASLPLGELARRASQRASQAGLPRFQLDIMTLLGDPLTTIMPQP